jgi:hypothetical protein
MEAYAQGSASLNWAHTVVAALVLGTIYFFAGMQITEGFALLVAALVGFEAIARYKY